MIAQENMKTLNERSALLFLVLLLFGDLSFVVLHCVNDLTEIFKNELLSIQKDNGYSEMYQYLKFFWVIIILFFVSIKNTSLLYVSWASIFTYFLLDDSLQVHEGVGRYIAKHLNIVPILALRLQDYGELAASVAAGIIFFLPLAWAYRKGSRIFRKVSQDLALLILILIFFGIFVDMVHVAFRLGWPFNFVLNIIEDGGEMISVSFILWYAFLVMVRDCDSGYNLCDCARIILTNKVRL